MTAQVSPAVWDCSGYVVSAFQAVERGVYADHDLRMVVAANAAGHGWSRSWQRTRFETRGHR